MNGCPHCNRPVKYFDVYDVYYCEVCDKWLEEKCSDPTCEFCLVRPERPSSIAHVIYSEGRKWKDKK